MSVYHRPQHRKGWRKIVGPIGRIVVHDHMPRWNLARKIGKMMNMNDIEGEQAVRLARMAVEAETMGKECNTADVPPSFREERGVFVTLSSYPSMLLRGCIGFPEPIFSLASALIQAAQYACHDPGSRTLGKMSWIA